MTETPRTSMLPGMDFALDDDQCLIVAMVRRLTSERLAPWAADADRAGRPPEKLFDIASDVGFMLDAVPESHGGMLVDAFDHITRALRGMELARACSALAALLECNVESALAVTHWGSRAAQQQFFGALGDGARACMINDFEQRLEVHIDVEGAARVTGSLGPIPALHGAAYALLCARDEEGAALLLLPIASDGVALEPMTPSAWRAAKWAKLTCSGAIVPAELVLARGDTAAQAIESVLSWHRLSLGARAVGAAAAAMEHAKLYASERMQFGKPIGAFESIIALRDGNETAIAAARALVLEAAWKLNCGAADAADAASRARAFAVGTLSRAAIDAVQIFGGYGFVNDYPVEKIMRDARAFDVLLGNEELARVLEQRGEN